MLPLPPGSQVFPDADAVARAAADHLLQVTADAPDERVAICLSGGSTPKRLYELLASPDYVEQLPWSRIHWFFGDDRVVPWDDVRSNVRLVREAFGHGDTTPAGHFHFIPSDHGPEAGARAYAETLTDYHGSSSLEPGRPLFDLVLLGLGGDGHTASLFPGKPEIDEREAWVVPVPEAGMEPFVPRISLTLPALASSRSLLYLVTGQSKRDPLRRIADGANLPAGRVAGVGRTAWFLDRVAADA